MPGSDNIIAELLQVGEEHIVKMMHQLFNKIHRQDCAGKSIHQDLRKRMKSYVELMLAGEQVVDLDWDRVQ